MGKCQPIVINGTVFKTQSEFKCDVRKRIETIGITQSVKSKCIDSFYYFTAVCQRHPNCKEKLQHMVDYQITQNLINHSGLALHIVNSDMSLTEISWIKCISGTSVKSKDTFIEALRHCIYPQIQEFKQQSHVNLSYCLICKTESTDVKYHIDHEIQFAKLVEDFMQQYPLLPIPLEYDKESCIYLPLFKKRDMNIRDLFYDYHQKHAKLRVLCETCNLTRPKYKK